MFCKACLHIKGSVAKTLLMTILTEPDNVPDQAEQTKLNEEEQEEAADISVTASDLVSFI